MHDLSAKELSAAFVKGTFSAVEIVTYFLERIHRLDGQVGAFLSTFDERVLQKAEALDAKKAAGKPLAKLAAVPVAIKDNIHVEGELTTCASKFLTNYKAPFASTVVRLLEEEDALIIGKTNMDEFAMGSSSENSALQKTFNPWNVGYVPGGSSGGSAAAVAARLCPLALGSDTGGSIRQPAAFCGVVGFKPTYGRVSRFGLVAFGSSLDQIGPLATNVGDAAMMLEVIGQPCSKDSTSLPMEGIAYGRELDGEVKGLKVGVPYELLEKVEEGGKKHFEENIERLKEAGAQVVPVDLTLMENAVAVYYILATAEASTNLARFDGVRYGVRSPRSKTLDEVFDYSREEGFGEEVKRRILLGTFVLSSGYFDAYYKKAQKVRTLMIEATNKAFESCDVIAMPTTTGAAHKMGAIRDPLQLYLADIFTIPANLTGCPAVSIPSGFSEEGMPLSLQLLGAQGEDGKVLSAAHRIGQLPGFEVKVPSMEASAS